MHELKYAATVVQAIRFAGDPKRMGPRLLDLERVA